jgi:hypothetical protein
MMLWLQLPQEYMQYEYNSVKYLLRSILRNQLAGVKNSESKVAGPFRVNGKNLNEKFFLIFEPKVLDYLTTYPHHERLSVIGGLRIRVIGCRLKVLAGETEFRGKIPDFQKERIVVNEQTLFDVWNWECSQKEKTEDVLTGLQYDLRSRRKS